MTAKQRSARIQSFESLCRGQGLAVTVQRRAIFESVLDRRDHPTADEVFEQISAAMPGVSRATVYRTLETLVCLGVITKACTPGAATRYDPMTHAHHHLICERCEKLFDVEDRELESRIKPPRLRDRGGDGAFVVHGYSIRFHGLCAACSHKQPKP